MSATSKLILLKQALQKAPNLDLSTIGDDKYILTLCLGDMTISIGSKKNFFTHRMVVEPRNKTEIWSLSFLPSFRNSFAAFTDKKMPMN